MPLFYFVLKHGGNTIPDRDGLELADQTTARAHACAIAYDLMRNREVKTRLWCIDVCDENLASLFNVHFAEIDETLRHLPAQWRETVVTVAQRSTALNETINAIRATLDDARSTLAKVDRWGPRPPT